jgi:hypothetical protein
LTYGSTEKQGLLLVSVRGGGRRTPRTTFICFYPLLKKIEQSKPAIREVKTPGGIKKLVDQSEALKACAKSAQMPAEIQSDIAELNLIATRRPGEISAALEKAKGGQPYQNNPTRPHSGQVETKTAALSGVGVSRQRANEAEKPAKTDDGVFNGLCVGTQ